MSNPVEDTAPEAETQCADAAMTPMQRRLSGGGSRVGDYRDLLVGRSGWPFWAAFEGYNLFAAGLGSIAGIALRSALLPFFLKACGRGAVVGRGVTIRQPRGIVLGRGVIIDDYAVLDIRSAESAEARPGIEIGERVMIGRGSIITTKGGFIRLGRACNVSSGCRIATRSRIDIGESVLIAAYVYIGCGNHSFEDTSRPMIEQDMDVRGGVTIGAGSWIGARATILDGVSIGENAIVGAHALVKDDVPAGAIAAGIPARVIRMRGAGPAASPGV